MKRVLFIFLSMVLCSAITVAQQKLSFSVLEFEQDPFDLTAKSTEYGKKDGNGSWYAIIKVTNNSPEDDITACQFNFGNMSSKVEKHDEALWVYVQRNAKKVTISRPGYHTINQYDLQTTIEAGCVYKMKLTSDRIQQQVVYDVNIQMVKFVTSPAVKGVVIMATNQDTGVETAVGVTDENGVVYKAMDNGKYSYRIMSTDNMYHHSEGIMTLISSDETHEEKVTLRPNYADIVLNAEDNAEILINNERKGNGSWHGRLTAGTYIVTTKKANHRDNQQRLIVEEGKAQTIQLNAPTPIIGTLIVNSQPYEADITIDGKDYGKAPRIIKDMLIGQHDITFRKEGYTDFKSMVDIEEGKTATVNVELQKITDPYYGKSAKELCDLGNNAYNAKDYTTAFPLYQKAADQGDASAQCNLGNMYSFGYAVTQDYSKAAYWYQKSADQGYARAQNNLGLMYLRGYFLPQDYSKAVYWFQKSADQGEAIAQCNLGFMYENGYAVTQDYSKAVYWYQKSADQGYARAQNNLGTMYYNGSGVTQDYSKAVYWYQKSADQGDASAQCNLGFMYENGYDVTQDYSKAVYWYQKSADQGYAWAQNNLGTMYYNGSGVTQDYSKAVYWYQKSADQGDASAQFNLGLCYEYGHGVKVNRNQAKILFKKAADQGDKTAKEHYDKLRSNRN